MIRKIASNTLAQILSKIITAVISIFLLSLLTNYFSQEMFWLYSKLYNYLWIFAFLADLGLYTIAIREITRDEKNASKVVGNILTLRVFFWVITLFLAFTIAFFLPGYHTNLALVGIGIVWIFTIISLINSSILSLMQATMKIEFNLVSTVLGKLVNLFLIFCIIMYLFPKEETISINTSFILVLLSWIVWIIINTYLNYKYAKKIYPIQFLFDWAYIKHIIIISLPYALALFLSVVYFKIDVILISLLEPENMRDISVALYSLPMKIVEVLMVLSTFYLNSILPSLSKGFEEKSEKKTADILNFSFHFLLALGMILLVLWVLLRDTVILLIANESYLFPNHIYNASDAFVVVLVVIVFYFLWAVFNYALIASHKQSKLLQINIVITLINIIWNLIFIPKYSFLWAGIVTVLSQIGMCLLWYNEIRNTVKFVFDRIFILKILLLSWLLFYIGLYIDISEKSLFLDLLIRGWGLFAIYIVLLYVFHYRNEKIKLIAARNNPT